jgi:CheY-like chemotaxis protein
VIAGRCPSCDREVYVTDGEPDRCPVCSSALEAAPPRARVLIVDDDEDIRDALRLLFEEDYDVVGLAGDGTEAVEISGKTAPDVIVLDYLMPGMSGEQVAGVLREIVPSARIVAFSAILDTKPLWADAFLNKSRIDEIAPLIGALLQLDTAGA